MKHSIRVRTTKFLLTQGLIIIGIMAAFLWLSCVFFVKNATHWHLANIEQELKVFTEQAIRSGEVPKRGDLGVYSFFIINVEGKYILPRMPRSDEGEQYWQKYESKIIYEMQKRRDGWSYYPERRRTDFRNGKYMLRYIYVADRGWIIAVEGYMPGMLVLLQEMLTPTLFIGMALISLAAFVFMLLNANWHFHRVVRAILRSQENNFIAVDGVPAIKKSEKGSFMKPEDRLPIGGATNGFALPASSRKVDQESAMRRQVEPDAAPSSHAERLFAAPVQQSDKLEGQGHYAEELRPLPAESQRNETRGRNDLGGVVIDTTDIRSPILRKAIEELRAKRD